MSSARNAVALLCAAALGALAVPEVAGAANGDPVLAGRDNVATSTTFVRLGGAGDGGSALRAQASGANFGLTAESAGGTGVQGTAVVAGASGVRGINVNGGSGVSGQSDNPAGVGVLAHSAMGTALAAEGKVKLSRSGRVKVPAGSRKVTVSGVDLNGGSLVIATVQRRRPGVWLRAAVPDGAANSFTIYLNKASEDKRVPVAWFILD